MYLTAQRVTSTAGESGINGFLYEHGQLSWEVPPKPVSGSIGELVHSFLVLPPGGNKVMSYIDIIAPDDVPFDLVRARVLPWIVERANGQGALPWVGVSGDMRFGLHMVSAYAEAWKPEVTRLLRACQMTFDRYRCAPPADAEPRP